MKKERNNHKSSTFASVQLTLFDDLLDDLKKDKGSVSSSDITRLIRKLTSARDDVKRREDKERIRKAKEDARRKAEEEKRRQEEHIKEVTSMVLPLDFENVFLSDERVQGMHVC